MKTTSFVVCGVLCSCILNILIINFSEAEQNYKFVPQLLIRKVETQYQGNNSHAKIRMKVITNVWSREITLEAWSEGRDKFIAKILAPKKEAGTATLKIKDEIWNYLPKIDRLMKIPSSLMGDRWMGSHLTNDDLVKESKMDELYTFEAEKIENSVATIICTPKTDAAVVWDRVVYRIDLEKTVPISVDYYDEDGDLVRTITFEQVENISGRWVPMVMEIRPVDEPDEMTEMIYESLEFDIKLPENLFSVQSLRRR